MTLTLDWVFADAQRISFGYSITGLADTSNALNSSGKITVKDEQGNAISEGGESVQQVEGQPGTITGTWSKVMQTPLSQSEASLSIDIEVTLDDGSGGAEFARPPGSTALPPDVVPTTLPNRHIGPFHFDVLLPIYPLQVFAPKQSATAKGITIRLEKAEITPSYARFMLCYPKPSVKDWMLGRKTTLQAGAVQAQYSSYTLLADLDYGGYMSNPPQPTDLPPVANGERCVQIDFLLGHSELPQSLVLTIPVLEQSVPEVIPDAALKAAREKLKEQGIEVEYITIPVQGGGGGGGYRVTKKPEWMDDQEAMERFYAALGYYFPGPWIFTIPTQPQTSTPIALVKTAPPPPPDPSPVRRVSTSTPAAAASDWIERQPSPFPGSPARRAGYGYLSA